MATIVFSDITSVLKVDSGGNIALVTNEESVRQAVVTILSTKRGERVMLPAFGSTLHRYLFDPIDSITERLMQSEIRAALNKWEDRITIQDIRVVGNEDDNSYQIDIVYFITKTKQGGFFQGRVRAAE